MAAEAPWADKHSPAQHRSVIIIFFTMSPEDSFERHHTIPQARSQQPRASRKNPDQALPGLPDLTQKFSGAR
jgi:hypothetical protein